MSPEANEHFIKFNAWLDQQDESQLPWEYVIEAVKHDGEKVGIAESYLTRELAEQGKITVLKWAKSAEIIHRLNLGACEEKYHQEQDNEINA
jgi:hypothetical protein